MSLTMARTASRHFLRRSSLPSLDDSAAREEWGWSPSYDLDAMVADMFENLSKKVG